MAQQQPQQPAVLSPEQWLAQQEDPSKQSSLRQVADVPLKLGQGAITGVRMVADSFGAGSGMSEALKGAEDYLGDLLSAQSKRDAKEISRIMKEAQDKGALDQVQAALKALTVAPVDLITNALGTAAPVLAATLLGGSSALAARAIGAGVGVAMGAGTVKGTIYDAVKDELKKTDMTAAQIEERAQLAQAYGGKNLDMILAGAALGGFGAASGFEPAAAKAIAGRIAGKAGAKEAAEQAIEATAKKELEAVAKRGAIGQGARTGLTEFGTEAIQGSQEQLAENVALRREGYDVPIMRGVISQGVLEGMAGFGLGAPMGAIEGRRARQAQEIAPIQLSKEDMAVVEAPLTKEEAPDDVQLDAEYIKTVATDLIASGVLPASAREMAVAIATEEARADALAEKEAKGAENAAASVTPAGGVSPEVAGQPSAEPAAPGAGGAEPSGVVPPGPNAADLTQGKAVEPVALTPPNEPAPTTPVAPAVAEAPVSPAPAEPVQAQAPAGTPETLTPEQQEAEFDAKLTAAKKIAKSNFDTALDQVDDPMYGGDIGAALDAYYQNTIDTLAESGETDPNVINRAITHFERLVDEHKNKALKDQPADVVAEKVEPLRLEPGEVVEPTPKPAGKKRGPKGARLTEEQKTESKQRGEEGTKLWKAINSTVNKAVAAFNEAITPLDPDNYPDIQQFQEAVESRRIQKIQAIKTLLEQQRYARGKAKLEAAINEALAHKEITPKEIADIKEGMKRVSKASTEVKVGRADTRFNNFSNAEQALRHVIKTGNPFQRFLAQRLLPFVKGVNFTVLEEGEVVPDVIRDGGATKDWEMSRGLFLREVASGQRHIFVRGMSGGPSQGINNVTVLHEALHAALNKKMDMADWSLRSGFDRHSDLTRAFKPLAETIRLTQERMAAMEEAGTLPDHLSELVDAKIFEDAREFVAYAMTDPIFQKFLMQTPGVVKESLFTRFVNSVRRIFGMEPGTVNALSDVINITDKMLSARMTPLMREELRAEQETAGDAEVSSMAKKNVAKTDKLMEKVAKSHTGTSPQLVGLSAIAEAVKARDGKLAADVLAAHWDAWKSGSMRQLLPALQTETIIDWVKNIGKKVPGVGGWADHLSKAWGTVKDANAMRVAGVAKAAPISDKLLRLAGKNQTQYRALANVMHYSTLAKVDPSKDTKLKALNELWAKLDDDTKALYNEVREYYSSNYDLYHQLLTDQIEQSKIPGTSSDPNTAKGKLMAEIKKMYETGAQEVRAADGTMYRPPYFPLVRYGQFWLRLGSGKSREFYMFESQAEREVFLRQRVRAMKESGDTRTYEEMYEDGDVQKGDNIQEARQDIKDSSALIKSLFEAIEDAAGRPIAVTDDFGNQVSKYSTIDPDKMKDEVYQLYLHTLPERNFRRQFIHRQGTTGFSQDISRNFATTSTNMANQLARIKYGPTMVNEVQAARDALKGNPDEAKLAEFVSEMRMRVEQEAYPDPGNSLGHRMAEMANKTAFLWMMSTIKTAVAQFSALPVFVAPVLASKHGPVATAKEMGRFMNVFNNLGVIKEDGSFVAPTIAQSRNVKLNAEEGRAAQYMVDRGISETTMAYDLGNRRKRATYEQHSTAYKVTSAITNVMTGLFHHAERMIREVAFMSSFRLYRDKFPNMAFEEVAKLAEQDTYTALGNFSSANRPRGLIATAERKVVLDAHKPLGRGLFQFKMFPAFVTTYFVRNFYRMTAKDMTKEERKQAAVQFFGSMMMSFSIAGYMGVPGISFAMGLAQGLRNLFKDEDDDDPLEKRDLEFWFRNIWLQQTFGNVKIGDHNLADLMNRGLVASLTGYDISSSLSLNNMWFPDVKEQATAEATMGEYLKSLAGPFASLAVSQVPRAVDKLREGKILEGIEQLLPGMARSPVTAYRYSQEGATTAAGAPIKDAQEFTLGQLVAQGMGFSTEGLVARREDIFKAQALRLQVQNEKKALLNRLDVGLRSDRDVDKVLDDVFRFNAKNSFDPIDADSLTASIINRLEQRILSDRGMRIDEKYYPQLIQLMEPSSRRLDVEARK
jgi:hypothetical protein